MIDFVVARDKLAGFETADEIAQFLLDQGVKGTLGSATNCAISMWMKEVTGDPSIRTTQACIACSLGLQNIVIETNTDAMADFVSKFDEAQYPALLDQYHNYFEGMGKYD